MKLKFFVILGILANASAYLVQNRPTSKSVLPLQLGISNNVLRPSEENLKSTKDKKIVLDINCEKGISTNRLQDIFFNYKVVGFDKDEKNIKFAQKTFPNQHFQCIDFDSNIFPYYSMRESCAFINVNSFKDIEMTMVKCHFLLEPGGKFILPFENSDEKILEAVKTCNLDLEFTRHKNFVQFNKK